MHASKWNPYITTEPCLVRMLSYLLCQLPGRSQNQSLGGFHLHINLLENGNGKSGSLPSARLGLSDHIITWRQSRDTSNLSFRVKYKVFICLFCIQNIVSCWRATLAYKVRRNVCLDISPSILSNAILVYTEPHYVIKEHYPYESNVHILPVYLVSEA